jgi:putative ABC transport system permease protein
MLQDLRYAVRTLLRTPAFTLTAVLTLSLGIGANTAMFSVVNAVLLRPLSYADPERLTLIFGLNAQRGVGQIRASALDFADWKRESRSFDGMAGHVGTGFTFTGDGEPELVIGQLVTEDLFSVLGIRPALGRAFDRAEFTPGQDRTIVLGHALWQRRYGSDRTVVGRDVTVNGKTYTVVGVMPPGFVYPDARYQLWAPLSLTPAPDGLPINRNSHFLQVVGRLKPAIALREAQSEMSTIAGRLAAQYPDSNAGLGTRLVPLREQAVGDVRTALLVLLGAVGFVVLIACANVTNLLLARATGRQREVAIRAALGAGRVRLIRQFLTETIVLYGLGAAGALAFAAWGLALLVALSPGNIPRLTEASIDARVLGVTIAVSLVTALVFGLAPALQGARAVAGDALKGGRITGAGGARQRLRAALVVAEVALSVVLLVGAGLAIRSFVRLVNVDPGFDADDQLTFGFVMSPARYADAPQMRAFQSQLLAAIAATPGVQAAGATTHLPFSGQNLENSFTAEGFDVPAGGDGPVGGLRGVSGDYFAALGAPAKRGRAFSAADRDGGAPVAIVNETFAKRYWPGQDPIGKRLKVGGPDSPDPWREVVGVIADLKHSGPAAETRPEVSLPYAQLEPGFTTTWARGLSVVVRGLPSANLTPIVRQRVRELDAAMPMNNVQAMSVLADGAVSQPRFRTVLLAVFAALALTLATIGVFGVLSYFVIQRTREIGVRLALGAQPSDVVRMVVGRGLALAGAGICAGLVAAIPLSRAMQALLFDVAPFDVPTFAAVAATLAAVAALASYLPARRATRVDPIAALRME